MTTKALKEQRGQKLKELETLNTELADTTLSAETRSQKQQAYTSLAGEVENLTASIQEEEAFEAARAKMAPYANPAPAADGEQREIVEKYNLHKVVRHLTERTPLDGFEKEMHEEGVKEAQRAGTTIRGTAIPEKALMAIANSLQKRAMTAGTNNQGGYAVPTITGDFIDYLFNSSWVSKFGVQTYGGLTGNLNWPKNGAATASWLTETGTLSASTPTIGQLALSPKRLGCLIEVSKLLAVQVPELANRVVFETIYKSLLQKLESSLVDSVSNGPTGLIDTNGIGDVAIGTNGGAPTYSVMVDLMSDVDVANALMGNLGYLTTPEMYAKLMKVEMFSGTNGMPVNQNGKVIGYDIFGSNAVPKTLVKGSSSDCHAIIFGNFNELIIGQWGGYDMTVDPYTKMEQGLDRVMLNTYFDFGIRHPEGFSACLDARNV